MLLRILRALIIQVMVLLGHTNVAALTAETSNSKAIYLGIDVGTQGTKVLAYCPDEGRVIARVSRSYDVMPTSVPGRAEQHPNETWMPAIDECFTELGNKISLLNEETEDIINYKIKGIGVSGQQHGMVALDSQLNPLRPAKLWCDVEAVEETKLLQTICKEENLDFLTPSFTAPKILWMQRNEPELYSQAKWFVLPHDYVTMKLANLRQPITDAGDASGNGIFVSEMRQNSKHIANAIDESLMDKLPTVLSPNQVAGILDDCYVRKLTPNVPSTSTAKAIPLSVGSGDNMCSALGVGCVSPGQAVLSLGTSGTIFAVSDTPVVDSPCLAPFCDAAGRYLPLACTMSCTGVLTQVLNEWTDWSSHDVASKHAASVEIGCHGITFLPYLGGERTPNWPHATGALLGLTSTNLKYASDPAVMYRACLEGITFLLADALDHFPNKSAIKTLLVVGGGAKNPLWQQMIADILNCRLEFPLEAESAALGAAFQAGAAATGATVEDFIRQQSIDRNPAVVEPKNHEAYQEAFQRYKASGQRLFDGR
jgi:xylulokinase